MRKWMFLMILLVCSVTVSAQKLAELHDLLIKFYGYQRAGLKSGTSGNLNNMNEHKGDSYNNTPLDGGWYDAGDYIKFGMPMSYAVYCLLKGYDIFPGAYADTYKQDHGSGTDGIPDVLNQVKYATDFMMKAVIDENTIILDVGKAEEEHKGLDDPIPFAGGRNASQCVTCSGADIPATYAACLALMATCYRKYDAKYADECLAKAIVAFKFAKKKVEQGGDNNLYCQAQKKSNEYLYYYYDPGDGKYLRQINDRLVAAGVELYRATKDADPEYKLWARRPISDNFNVMGYSFIGPLASFSAWRQGLVPGATSVSVNVGFVAKSVQATGVFKGVYKNSGWGTAREIGTAAFVYALGYVVTSSETQRADYLKACKDHVAWVTGTNSLNKSFVIGYGSSYPTSIHYRPSISGPKGGLVSGPDGDGNWANDRSAEYCEVAVDYNAGIVGAVAFLKAIESPSPDEIQVKVALAASLSGEIDLTAKSVTFSATLSKSTKWTLTISGESGSKQFTGTDAGVSATWDGGADNGLFLSGETVAAKLEIEGTIAAYDVVKMKAVNLFIKKAKKPTASVIDVLIDDFEDGDTLNKVTGVWQPFGNQTSFAGKTKLNFSTQDGSKALDAVCNVTSDARSTFAGARATFNPTGAVKPMPGAKTVVFDMKANKDVRVFVELEQQGITDSAYYGLPVSVMTLGNTYRLDITKFKQPDWKTVEKPLDLGAITALRFTVYDSTGLITLKIDNVAIEGLSTSTVVDAFHPKATYFSPVITNSMILYSLPKGIMVPVDCSVFDIAGKVVAHRTILPMSGAGQTSISIGTLPSGVYSIRHSIKGKSVGEKVLFTRLK